MQGRGVKWPHEGSVHHQCDPTVGQGIKSPSHLAPPRAAYIGVAGSRCQVVIYFFPTVYFCLLFFFFFLRSLFLLRTKHPAASGPKTRLGLRQAGHVLPCGPVMLPLHCTRHVGRGAGGAWAQTPGRPQGTGLLAEEGEKCGWTAWPSFGA